MSRANVIDVDVSLMRPADRDFVEAGWKLSARHAPQNEAIPSPKFFETITRQLHELLARSTVSVLVARARQDPRVLYGFVCAELEGPALALHYAYTARAYKKLGVCSELLRHALQGASDADQLVYTAGSRFDGVWERWGFRRVDLNDWLRDSQAAVNKLTNGVSRSASRGKAAKQVLR